MQNRQPQRTTWTQFTRSILPAFAKTISMMGEGSFIGNKLGTWIPYGKTAGTVVSVVATVAAGLTSVIARGIRMYYRRLDEIQGNGLATARSSAVSLAMPEDEQVLEDPNDDELQNPAPIKATWCHPGVETTPLCMTGYKTLHVFVGIYIGGCITFGGYLSSFSLATLAAELSTVDFDSKCDDTQSDTWKIIIVHLAAILLIYANIESYEYNINTLRDYYKNLFINGEWKTIPTTAKISTGFSTGINTLQGWYSNIHTLNMLETYTLCHIKSTISIPTYFSLPFAATTSGTSFILNSLMQIVPNAKQDQNIMSNELATLLEGRPWFRRLNPLINAGIFTNALFKGGLMSALCVAKLPETVNHPNADVTYHPAMIVFACLIGLNGMRNQWGQDKESYIRLLRFLNERELEASLHITNNPALIEPLLDEDNDLLSAQPQVLSDAINLTSFPSGERDIERANNDEEYRVLSRSLR